MPRLFGRKCYFRVKERGNTVTGFSVLSVREESAGKRGSRRNDSAREFPELSAGSGLEPMDLEEIYERTLTLKGRYTSKPPLYPSNSSFPSYLPFRFGFPFFVRSLIVPETVLGRTSRHRRRSAANELRRSSFSIVLVKELWLRKKTSRFSLRRTK